MAQQEEYDGWFDQAMRTPHSSAAFTNVGDMVAGDITDIYKIDRTEFATGKPIINERTGQPEKQLVIVIQTNLRGWAGGKPVKDRAGNALGPEHDDGTRALYFPKGTNIYSALGEAIQAAGERNPAIGGKVAVKFIEQEDTGKGNPLKKFAAKYKAPERQPDLDGAWDQPTSAPQQQAPAPAPQPQQQAPAPAPQPQQPPQQPAAADPWSAPAPQQSAPAATGVFEDPPF